MTLDILKPNKENLQNYLAYRSFFIIAWIF